MKKNEVAFVTAPIATFGPDSQIARPDDPTAEARIKVVFHDWRNDEKITDCGNVLKKTLNEAGDDSRRAQNLDAVTVA